MRRRGTWLAAGVVVISNLAALGSVALDRRTGPQSTLVLTERELSLPPREAENTALTLRLRWTDPAAYSREHPVDRAKLEELGFDCSRPLEGDFLARYRALPPRKAFAALEHDGRAWQRYREHLESQAAREAAAPETAMQPRTRDLPGPQPPVARPEQLLAGSRLVVLDAGRDLEALRARYADRSNVVIVPAAVRLEVGQDAEGLYLSGRVVSVYPFELNVPSSLRTVLDPLRGDARSPEKAGEPRYTVTVNWGRRAPWIANGDVVTVRD